MGAKDWFICYADGDVSRVLAARPELDRAATEEVVGRLFPDRTVVPDRDGTLGEDANPEDDRVFAAVWPGATIVCTGDVALDRPSQIDRRFLAEAEGRTTYVHAMHSVTNWFALGVWGPDGGLQRALSVSGADEEVLEDVGEHLPFEAPFWAGELPAVDDDEEEYPFPFHPLELGEAALGHLFGFVFEGWSGMPDGGTVDPFDVTLAGFRLTSGAQGRSLFRRR